MKNHAIKQTAHEAVALDPNKAPKKNTIGPADDQLHVGALVFYHGERWFVSVCPDSWEETHHIRITNKPLMRNTTTHGLSEDQKAECQYCHGDCVTTVPDAPKGRKARTATVKSIERERRAKAGVRDVGDEVANILRDLTLEQMFETAAGYLNEPLQDLINKYAHLDNGRKRMVLGNRMRAKYKQMGA